MILAGDHKPDTKAFRAFLARYAHYVLLRAQCFGGMFTEIAEEPRSSSSRKESSRSSKSSGSSREDRKLSLTQTCLKPEHLEASEMLLKAGLACALDDEEVCENTAIALERVVSDLIGLTTAVATALNKAIKCYDTESSSALDKGLVKKWCEFYKNELLPKTKGMVKKSSPILDPFGMFLPSRMGVSVSQDILMKGLKESGSSNSTDENQGEENDVENKNDVEEDVTGDREEADENQASEQQEEVVEDEDLYDEYEYDEYDEYDAEE
jgi:hypothetical protein